MIVGFSVAACSGVFAALASVLSKLALEDGGVLIRAAVCPRIPDEYCDTASILVLVIPDWIKIRSVTLYQYSVGYLCDKVIVSLLC